MARHRASFAMFPTTAPILGALILTLGGAAPAQAGGQACMDRERMTAALSERYGERSRAIALLADGRMLEVFASQGGRSWTLFATSPEGTACVIASGKHWLERTAPPEGIETGLDAS